MAVHSLILAFCLAAPVYGPTVLGHTYRSAELRPDAHSCPAMAAYYGDCWYHPYPAIDFLVPVGTPARAVADGTVVLEGVETDRDPDAWPRRPGRFLLLALDVPQGDCRVVAYKHLSRWRARLGDRVTVGQVIAFTGDTQSPNPHLHVDCFTSVEAFNTYPGQAWWSMRWCNRTGTHEGTPGTLRMGARLRLGPCL